MGGPRRRISARSLGKYVRYYLTKHPREWVYVKHPGE